MKWKIFALQKKLKKYTQNPQIKGIVEFGMIWNVIII